MNVAFRQNHSVNLQHLSPQQAPLACAARIAVYDDFAQAEPAWRALQSLQPVMTPYQRFEWIALWHRHVSKSQGAIPLIVVGYDDHDTPLFLLPLLRRRSGPLMIAEYFGGRHANLNAGIWRHDIAASVTAADLQGLLAQVAGSHGIDLFVLLGQPFHLDGVANPLLLLPHRTAPDEVHTLELVGDTPDQTFQNAISSNMRGRLRGKERKLKALEGYRYFSPATSADVERILDAFFVQKAARMAAQGIDNAFATPGIAAFVRAACHEGLAQSRPTIELHALEGGGEVIAVFGAANDGRRMSCMFNSYTLGDNGRWSPGLILLSHMIARCAKQRIATFDLGVGHAHYKGFFCKTIEPTFDSFVPFSPIGRLAAIGLQSSRKLKGLIKSNPYLWDAAQALRRRFGG